MHSGLHTKKLHAFRVSHGVQSTVRTEIGRWSCRVMKQHPSLHNWLEWRDCIVVLLPVLKITGSQVNFLNLALRQMAFHPPLSKAGWLPPINAASLLADAGPVSVVSEASLFDWNHHLMERTGESEGDPLTWFRTMRNIEISGWAWSIIWTGWVVDSEKWWCPLFPVPHCCWSGEKVRV